MPGLHKSVAQCNAGGGRLHQSERRRIAPPAEVLPRWHRAFETTVRKAVPDGAVSARIPMPQVATVSLTRTGLRADEAPVAPCWHIDDPAFDVPCAVSLTY